jgi:uncharacterized protein
MASTNQPITDAEYDRMASILSRFRAERAMNLEMLDGFFAALICGPDTVLPSEYLPEIWGGEMADQDLAQPELMQFLDLAMRHWNMISHTLHSEDVYLPLLLEDEQGITHANDWARGFMRGMFLRHGDWIELVNNEERGGPLVPIFALANEHHADPEMRPYKGPIDAQQREKLIVGVAAGVTSIYRYFAPHRRAAVREARENTTYRRTVQKIGRNDPCSCGSGKKFKHCCGKITLH